MAAAALVLAINAGLFSWLLRHENLNWLAGATLIVGGLSGSIVLVFPTSLRRNAAVLVLLIVAAGSTIFGWIWLLYVPSFLLLTLATGVSLIRNVRVKWVHRGVWLRTKLISPPEHGGRS